MTRQKTDAAAVDKSDQPFRGLHRRIGALRDSQLRALDRLRLVPDELMPRRTGRAPRYRA